MNNYGTFHPIRLFISDDFPEFGAPIIVTFKTLESAGESGDWENLICCSAEIGQTKLFLVIRCSAEIGQTKTALEVVL